METQFLEMVIVNIPNFVGFAVAVWTLRDMNLKLLQRLAECDCDPVSDKSQSE